MTSEDSKFYNTKQVSLPANGWVAIYRSLLTWEWFKDSKMVHFFIYILCKANHEKKAWKGVEVHRGQLIFGRKKASQDTGITEQSIRTCIKRLKSTGEITIESTNHYSKITINNYDSYQFKLVESNQPSSQQPASNQPPSNHKQQLDKETTNHIPWRNDYKIYLQDCNRGYKEFMEDKKLIEEQERLNPGVNVRLSIEKGYTNFWKTEAGWKKKKASKLKTIDWKMTIINSIGINKVYYTKEELALK